MMRSERATAYFRDLTYDIDSIRQWGDIRLYYLEKGLIMIQIT